LHASAQSSDAFVPCGIHPHREAVFFFLGYNGKQLHVANVCGVFSLGSFGRLAAAVAVIVGKVHGNVVFGTARSEGIATRLGLFDLLQHTPPN